MVKQVNKFLETQGKKAAMFTFISTLIVALTEEWQSDSLRDH